MATGVGIQEVTRIAAGAIARGIIVKRATGWGVDVCGAGEAGIGVAMEAASGAGVAIGVALISKGGECPVVSGASYSVDVLLASDAAGKAILATTSAAVIGSAMEAAGAADEEHTADLGNGPVLAL